MPEVCAEVRAVRVEHGDPPALGADGDELATERADRRDPEGLQIRAAEQAVPTDRDWIEGETIQASPPGTMANRARGISPTAGAGRRHGHPQRRVVGVHGRVRRCDS